MVSETGTVDVALVDTGTFDDWIVIKDIISRAMPKYGERQSEIAGRLSKLLNTTIEDENNPAGLTGIGLTFHDAIQNLGASNTLRQAVLRSFENIIVAGLGTLYDDLDNILSNREVSSEIERTAADRVVSAKQGDDRSAGPAVPEVAPVEKAGPASSRTGTVQARQCARDRSGVNNTAPRGCRKPSAHRPQSPDPRAPGEGER